MVLSKRVARFNRVVTNRVARPVAWLLPGFGVLTHRGRRSGREYRTPVNVFRVRGEYVVALTYGSGADWVRNVLAEGGCELRTRGRTVRLTAPRLERDESRADMPVVVRQILALNDVSEFLYLSRGSS